jgi:Protein of unknown function (DUF3237)
MAAYVAGDSDVTLTVLFITTTEKSYAMLKLIKEFDLNVDVKTDSLPLGPFGTRILGNVIHGTFSGPKLKGEIVGSSGDWALIDMDGFLRPDVRLTFKTVDAALIYVQFFGVGKLTPMIRGILDLGNDTPTSPGVEYLFVHPRMEAADPRYRWVNGTMFIGEGHVLPGPRAEYQVYRVEK